MTKTSLPVLIIRNMVLFPWSEIRLEFDSDNDKKVISVAESFYENNLIIVNNGVKDFLIPFVHDIILNVDLKKRIITVKNIKGLFD